MKNINLTEIDNFIHKTDYLSAIKSIIYIEKFLNSNYKYTKQIQSLIQKSKNLNNDVMYKTRFEKTSFKKTYNFGYTQNDIYNELDFESIFRDLDNELKNSVPYNNGIDYINQIINKKGLSNAQIANATGIDPSYLSKVLNKKKVTYDRDTLVKLCIGMGLNYDESREVLLKLGVNIKTELKRDKILIYGLQNNLSVMDIDYILTKFEEKPWIKKR